MKNYKVRNNIEIINEYIYLINELFIGKEVVIEENNELRCYIFMGTSDYEIELPKSCINNLINNSGIFKKDSGSLRRSVYILQDIDYLNKWCSQQKNNYLLNEPDIQSFQSAIKKLRRIKNLEKIL